MLDVRGADGWVTSSETAMKSTGINVENEQPRFQNTARYDERGGGLGFVDNFGMDEQGREQELGQLRIV